MPPHSPQPCSGRGPGGQGPFQTPQMIALGEVWEELELGGRCPPDSLSDLGKPIPSLSINVFMALQCETPLGSCIFSPECTQNRICGQGLSLSPVRLLEAPWG